MNIDFQSRTVASIRLQADGNFSASKEFDGVTLQIPVGVEVHAEPVSTWLCQNITLELFGLQPGGLERLVCAGPMSEVLESRRGHFPFQRQVQLRCTPNAVAEYERLRNGGPVHMRLKFRAQMHELELGTAHRKMLCQPAYVWGQEDVFLDKAKWTTALRNVGLSVSILFEIPFPLSGEIEDDALGALSAAFSSFENGGSTAWKDSVGHLRPYLETWFKANPKAATEPKDGSAADREWKLLNLRDALYKCCHFWVHESHAACDREDAVLAISTFAAILRSYRSGH